MYEYKATVTSVIDADTIDCQVDLGFHMTAHLRFRLARIDAPEIRGVERAEGLKATEYLLRLLNKVEGKITVRSIKTGNFGRWLAEVYIDGENINDKMIAAGHAVEYGK